MRYPTHNGLVVPITEIGYAEVPHERRRTTNHHLYYERAWYMEKPYRRVFRGLLPHVVTMRIEDHTELHNRYRAPIMPPDIQQIDVVEEYLATHGVIDVVYEKRTNQTYQVLPDQWQQIRGAYGKSTMDRRPQMAFAQLHA
jgi:hypothetical protein